MEKWKVGLIVASVVLTVVILALGLGLGLGLPNTNPAPMVTKMNIPPMKALYGLQPLEIAKNNYMAPKKISYSKQGRENIYYNDELSFNTDASNFNFQNNLQKIVYIGNLTANVNGVIDLPFAITGDLNKIAVLVTSPSNSEFPILGGEFVNDTQFFIYWENQPIEKQNVCVTILRKDFGFDNEPKTTGGYFNYINNFWFLTKDKPAETVQTFKVSVGHNYDSVMWFPFIKAGHDHAFKIVSVAQIDNSVEMSIQYLKESKERHPIQISLIGVSRQLNSSLLQLSKKGIST